MKVENRIATKRTLLSRCMKRRLKKKNMRMFQPTDHELRTKWQMNSSDSKMHVPITPPAGIVSLDAIWPEGNCEFLHSIARR